MSLIYLINLDGSDDRLASARAQLAAQGAGFVRVPAFDGRNRAPEDIPDHGLRAAWRFMGRPLSGGELGCYHSHLACARRLLDSGAPYAIVLEDDLALAPDAMRIAAEVAEWLDQQGIAWDLVNIGAAKRKIFTPLRRFGPHELSRAHYFPMTTGGLIWSRAGAAAFVQGHGRIFAPVDNYFRYWLTRRGTGFSVWPPLVGTTGAASDIDSAGVGRKAKAGRHPLYGAIKQRRLWADKAIAMWHKVRGPRRQPG